LIGPHRPQAAGPLRTMIGFGRHYTERCLSQPLPPWEEIEKRRLSQREVRQPRG
jgi:hypothetical protein